MELFLCPDDLLHMLPFDALADDSGEPVGKVLRIRREVSFARLVTDTAGEVDGEGLLVVGDVRFDSDLAASSDEGGFLVSSAPIELALRGASFGTWSELPGTAREAREVQELFERSFDGEPVLVLSGDGATKDALRAGLRGKRWVHLATHGWFAPDEVLSLASFEHDAAAFARTDLERTVVGFAPMTLCGLCLSGANRPRDALGRIAGILTAEELGTHDLSGCELAVLSACQTNVGIRRAGEGVLSLQTALHAAGARTAITSLWKVDDAATQRLFELFYTRLWQERLGKHEALWRAKMALRAEGHPPQDWAGWVLSGDPD
jgi:CHAT domain-containing protein